MRRIIATSIKEYLPPLLRVLFTLFKEKKGGHRIELEPGDAWFQDCLEGLAHRQGATLVALGPIARRPRHHADERRDDRHAEGRRRTASMPGRGRPAARNLAASRRKDAPQDIALVPLPLFHVYACVGVQSHSIISRTPMALVPNPRDIDDLLKTIKTVRPTLFSAVPALFIALLNHPKVKSKSVDFSSIRACFSGAAPLMAATKTQFEELTGGRIVEGYSLTEAMMACIVNPLNGINKVGSVGVPLPDVEVAIVDAETGTRFLPNGETGEIILRAPQLMAGYFNNAEETTRALRVHRRSTGRGPWLHTGDLGYLDEDSFLFIVDRQKDLIKTSGYQVWPREVEEVLAAHPCVQEVGVAGVPDDMQRRGRESVGRQARGHEPDGRRAARVLQAEPRAVQEPGARRVQGVAAEDDGRKGAPPGAGGGAQKGRSESDLEIGDWRIAIEMSCNHQHLQVDQLSSQCSNSTACLFESGAHGGGELGGAGVSPCTQIVSTLSENVEPSRASNFAVAHHSHGALGRALRFRQHRTGEDAAASAIRPARTSDRQTLRPQREGQAAMPADSSSDPGKPDQHESRHRTTRPRARWPRRYRHAARSCCRARRAASHGEARRPRLSRSRRARRSDRARDRRSPRVDAHLAASEAGEIAETRMRANRHACLAPPGGRCGA